jgi:hypothetical protein
MICDLCTRKPDNGCYCYFADIWMNTYEAECCYAFKRKDLPGYVEPQPHDPYP